MIKEQLLFNNFLEEVKIIFPNATPESVKLSRTLLSLDFCWCYGEIGLRNYPDKYHKQIIKINSLAKQISRHKGIYESFLKWN